ncbi:MAG: 2-dehydropantoate 2-reductase [Acidocella sp. 20-61-6]|nr:MAG: 2-dehydropantoate 2-reductase [Acidocella sp. 20-61-6]
MKIAVMGAGAVGCYYGGMLALAGHEVKLVARPPHAEAINRQGLRLVRGGETLTIPVQASADPALVRDAALILFCVKSNDTAEAGAAMAPFLKPDAIILSLQNGVDNAARLAETLGREVSPAVVYVATAMSAPGCVQHHGRGELVLGPGTASTALAACFDAAGIPTEISDNVAGALWAKLILNCAYNALSAIANRPYGELVRQPGVEAVIRDVVEECLAVAARMDIAIPGDIWLAVRRIAETMPRQFSSTAQDMARGKPTEIDHLNGYILRCGAKLGVRTPVNATLLALVKLRAGRD